MEQEEAQTIQPPKKRSAILLFFISGITMGLYAPFWYLRRSKEFEALKTEKKLSKKIAVFFLVTYFLFIGAYAFFSFASSETTIMIASILTGIIALLLFILHLFLAFRSRTIINQAWQKKGIQRKASWILTLFLSFVYLQYEINRTIDNKEMNKRWGPWLTLLFLIILPIIAYILVIVLALAALSTALP